MKLIKKIGLLFVLLFFVQLISAQKAWEKDWTKWDNDDVYKILNKSPWAKNIESNDVYGAYNGLNKRSGFGDWKDRYLPAPSVVVRLYSSLKIRQAFLRMTQLQAKYDEMSREQKEKFDEKTKNDLVCENCKNFYVFMLFQAVSSSNHSSIVGHYFLDEEFSFLKGKVFLLNEKDERRELARFIAPESGKAPAFFLFPILDEKKQPLVTAESKKITVKFKGHEMPNRGYLQDVQFEISKMLIDGKLDFDK